MLKRHNLREVGARDEAPLYNKKNTHKRTLKAAKWWKVNKWSGLDGVARVEKKIADEFLRIRGEPTASHSSQPASQPANLS